jgi:membrane protein DedA with SNARE-associated domain
MVCLGRNQHALVQPFKAAIHDALPRHGFFAIVEGEIYFSKASADVVNGQMFWPFVLLAGAIGGSAGDQFWFYLLRGRFHWLDRYPRLLRIRDTVMHRVHQNETGLVLVSRFLPGLRTTIPIACAYANMRPLKFSALNFASALMWAGAIMVFVAGGSSALGAFGLNHWWGPFIPALAVIVFFRWLGRGQVRGQSPGPAIAESE